jgi:hypothetical protein
MAFNQGLFDIDYLIYSSHKTATQTLVNTFNSNNFNSKHCHYLANIGIKQGSFQKYTEDYLQKNGTRINIISVFREPMERHISSFFQGYGTRPIQLKEVESEIDTIIYKYSIEQLQNKFISELSDKSLIGIHESIHGITRELQLNMENLNYNEENRSGLKEASNFALYFIRFDHLISDFEGIISNITGGKIVQKNSNMSNSKWYRDIYLEFKESLVVPAATVSSVYHSKSDLINLFYPRGFESTLNKALLKYANIES